MPGFRVADRPTATDIEQGLGITLKTEPNMRNAIGIMVVVACLFSVPAGAAGVQFFTLLMPNGWRLQEGAVWYPCASPPATVRLNRLEAPGVENCAIDGENLPLIVISHGARGWYGGHHDTAEALADAGFVVAAVTHIDEGREWQTGRPDTIRRLIDHMLGEWSGRAHLDPDRIGFFGFSRGGYTGLVVIGGVPDFGRFIDHCRTVDDDPLCAPLPGSQTGGNRPPPRTYTHDPRVKAAVIAAPLGLVFSQEGLKDVTASVQLWRAEHDHLVLYPYHAEAVSAALPAPPDYRMVAGAGHYSFLAPCTEPQARVIPTLCREADGFDRGAFHETFNAEMTAFFRSALGTP